jgi:hypothetical protein
MNGVPANSAAAALYALLERMGLIGSRRSDHAQ